MIASWHSLLPPLIVIIIASLTQTLNSALIVGIISACLIATDANVPLSLALMFGRIWQQISNLDNIYLYIFLIAVPSIVVLLNRGNGPQAFTRFLSKKIHSKNGAQMASIASSFILSIDDYLSILTNGHIMRSVTDHFGIARTKLAYLVHALSGTVVILSPISSWVAAITAYLLQAGIDNGSNESILIWADPFYIYLHTLPYIFYSLFTIITALAIVARGISFGPMNRYEIKADLHKEEESESAHHPGSLWDLFIPLGSLLVSIILGILYVGDCYLLGGQHSILDAFKNNKEIFFVLAVAGIFSLGVSLILAYIRNVIRLSEIPRIIYEGFSLMKQAIIMVFLASILSLLLRNDLMTGHYLATLCLGTVPFALLPVMFFILSLIISIATGSSWGTFGLMLPIAIPMLTSLLQLPFHASPQSVTLLYPVLGAIFSGALCGDHISPFSETTLMTAASTQVAPMVHVKTQFPYAIPVIIATLFSFIAAGYIAPLHSFWIGNAVCLGLGISICFALLALFNKNKK